MPDDALQYDDPLLPRSGATMPLPDLTPPRPAPATTGAGLRDATPAEAAFMKDHPGEPVPDAAPAPPKEKSAAERMVDVAVRRGEAAVRRDEAAAARSGAEVAQFRDSLRRQREAEDDKRRIDREGAGEELELLRQRRQLIGSRPKPLAYAPPPKEHYTMPPGLFGGSDAPGNQWANAMSVFGGIGPRGLMPNNIAAIKAMTGMLEGWHQGEKEKFDLEYRNWQEQNNYIREANAALRQDYADVLEDNRLSFEEKKAELALRAMPLQDTIAMETAQRGDLKTLDDLIGRRDAQMDKADEAFNRYAKVVTDWEKVHGGGAAGGAVSEAARQAALLWLDKGIRPASRSTAFNSEVYRAVREIGRERGMDETAVDDLLARSSQEFPAAQRGYAAFTTGRQGDIVRSLDVAVDHLDALREFGRALHNGDAPLVNRLANYLATQTGSPAPGNLQQAASIVGAEIQKALAASTQAERLEAGAAFDAVKSPAQLEGAIQTAERLLSGQLRGLRRQYEKATRRSDFDDLLLPHTLDVLERAHADAPAAAPALPPGWSIR